MTRIASVHGARYLGVTFGFCFLFAASTAYAQGRCTAPPPAPPNAAASFAVLSATLPAAVAIQWNGVPTTGANAVVSYFVEVGNAPGLANIAVFDTGRTAVSTLQVATDGTYHIRVRAVNGCGRSVPSPEAVITVVGAVAPGEPSAIIPLATVSRRRDILGDIYMVGEVLGAWGARAAPFLGVVGTFTNSAGEEIGTEVTFVYGRSRRVSDTRVIDDTTLGAGETGCFALYTEIPDAQVSGIRLGTGWDSSQLEQLRGNVVVQNIQQEADAVKDLRVRGQLRNAGTVNTTFNNVVLDVRDAQDRVIDCDFAFINKGSLAVLAPGQTDLFVNEHDIPFSSVTRVRAWAAWEEGDIGPTTPAATPWSWRRLVSDTRDVPVLDAKARARLRNAAIQRLRQIYDTRK